MSHLKKQTDIIITLFLHGCNANSRIVAATFRTEILYSSYNIATHAQCIAYHIIRHVYASGWVWVQ